MFLGRVPSQSAFQAARLDLLPPAWRKRVAREHGRRFDAARDSDAQRAANLWLLDLTGRAAAIRVPVHMADAELCEFAKERAREAISLAEALPGHLLTVAGLRSRLEGYVRRYGIEPPAAYVQTKTGSFAGVQDGPAVSRMTCPLWWRRRLRVAQGRAIEAEAVRLGYVHRRAEIYCSDLTHERRQQQRRRNALGLENTQAINTDTGDVFTLAELAAKSVANPRIRRGELMTRIAGFEAVAKGLGHVAEFVTLTAPSKYHAHRAGEGGKVEANPKYCGATPREGQQYLTKLWANLRAKLWRMGLRPYGFRIAEPHHDGCPHWHLLLFVNPWLSAGRSAVARLRAVFRRYALREDGAERGARKNRVKFVAIDPARGSAAGYIAKYVAKNIDGYQVQSDLYGNDAVTASSRVDAWASQWGIRQFQQIGGPPVGVWRELRRTAPEGLTETVEAARIAADVGNWARYVEVMGGPYVQRRELPVRLAMTRPGMRWNFAGQFEEDAPRTRYGDETPPAVFGVRDVRKDRAFQSRRYRWEIRRGSGVAAQPRRTWTRVNNCSQGVEDGQKTQVLDQCSKAKGIPGSSEIGDCRYKAASREIVTNSANEYMRSPTKT